MSSAEAPAPVGSAAGREAVMVAARDVSRTFGSGDTAVHALRGVSLTVGEGQLVAVRGRSGSGKTTLLNVIGGLDVPTGGTVHVAGQDVTAMAERDRKSTRLNSSHSELSRMPSSA